MRPSRFTVVQIVESLREVRAGTPAIAMCRRLGITQTTFYRWRAKYDCDGTAESTVVRGLREENLKLKQIVGDLMLAKVTRKPPPKP